MIGRLRKRSEFLATARGQRVARRCFVLERSRRDDDGPARFGFTVSKRTAKKAVERNRIRRRLREIVRLDAAEKVLDGHDYVLVGRPGALTARFSALRSEIGAALQDERLSGRRQGDGPRSSR